MDKKALLGVGVAVVLFLGLGGLAISYGLYSQTASEYKPSCQQSFCASTDQCNESMVSGATSCSEIHTEKTLENISSCEQQKAKQSKDELLIPPAPATTLP